MLAAMLPEAYAITRARAIAETGLADAVFAEACPFSSDQVLSSTFLPD